MPADGASTITVVVSARALPAGTPVTLTADRGSPAEATAPLVDDGDVLAASFVLTAPDEPGPLTLRASAASPDAELEGDVVEASVVEASVVVDAVPVSGPQFDLTGTFATYAAVRVKLSAGTLTPSPQCVVAPSIQRVEIVQEGERVTQRIRTCSVVLPPVETIVGQVTNETPPSFIDSIPEVETVATLTSLALGAHLDPPETLVVVGAALANPGSDELPTDADDSRVRDDDGDGQPGVTVMNSLAGEQHITYRNRGDTSGVVTSSHRIDGTALGDLVAITESSVLGFGNGFIPATVPLPSVFQTVRVDGAGGSFSADTDGDGSISCQEVLDAAPVVFDLETPPTPLDCGGL